MTESAHTIATVTASGTAAAENSRTVILFGTNWCSDSLFTRRHLTRLGVPFKEINIDADEEAGMIVERLGGGRRRIPTLIIGKKVLYVPDDDTLEDALTAEGFLNETR